MKFLKPLFAAFVLLTLGSLLFTEALQADATPIATKKQAVCNVSPAKDKSYTEDGCKIAFNAFPAGSLCKRGELVKLDSCTVNKNACVNNAGKTGQWCTCKYTCEKRA